VQHEPPSNQRFGEAGDVSMSPTNSNGLTSPQSQSAKTLSKRPAIFSPITPNLKEFSEVAAKFASRGHDLSCIQCEHRDLYYVSRNGQARVMSTWHDVKSVLVQIGSTPC
jgi:hypothetical protein